MSSTYSNSLRVELIGSGDQAGTWGQTTDNNFAYIFDTAIAGINTVTISSAAQALTYVNGPTSSSALNQSIYAILKLDSAAAASAIYAPPVSKQYIIWNNSSFTITIYNSTVIGNTTAAGTGIAIAAGNKIMVWSDGTNFYDVQAQNLTGTLAIANGGTGQTSANAAFNALAPAQTNNRLLRSNGTNTSFAQAVLTTDVTGTLPVANGGTAATTAQGAMNTLAGAVTSGSYLRGNGTNVVMNTIQVADVPTLNQNTTGTAAGLSSTLVVGSGGTGATTASGARTNLGLVIGTDVLSPSGSAASLTSFPTLNQNTTGTAAGLSSTLIVGSGGTGATTAAGARSNLGLVIGTDVLSPSGSAAGLTSFPTLNQNTTGNAATATALSTASGSAPSYSARAWVNFNGTDASIRASGNVSSITYNGVGDYTINFTTALPDANYALVGTAGDNTPNDTISKVAARFSTAPTTTAARLAVTNAGNNAPFDAAYVMVSVFR
jgi:hypothetical protein